MSLRGMTLAECVVAIVVASVLLAAVDGSLMAGRRYARAASAARGLRENLHGASSVLRAELEAASPALGDLVSISDSSVVIRAQRALGFACADGAGGALVLDDASLQSLRAIDPAKDSALVYRDGDVVSSVDDRWIAAAVTQVRRGSCTNGMPGTSLTLTLAPAELAAVREGAMVRVFEIDDYRRYRDATGAWWFGVRNPSGAGWSATSPIAGPLDGKSGFALRFLDAAGASAARPESVVTIEAKIRMQDARSFANLRDSLRCVVTPRGP